MFGPEPQGRTPGPRDAIDLDDTFLSGDPLAYFEARIDGLVAAAQGPSAHQSQGLGGEYLNLLGIRAEDISPADSDSRALQIALDAFSLRHHTAETLLRFLVAVVDTRAGKKGSTCLWFHASESPTRLQDVVKQYRELSDETLVELLLPPDLRPLVVSDARVAQAMHVMKLWIDRALFLVQRSDINLNGLANKIKHGLATRARDDLRLDMLSSTLDDVAPELRASVLNGPSAIRLFDAIAVEAIGRPSGKEALEHTIAMLRPAPLLAEAHMMARVHASAFHVAAILHLGNRKAFDPPPYPSLALGPEPQSVHRNAPVGSRRPITFHTDGSPPTRGRGFADERVFVPIKTMGPEITRTLT